jgi:hypothetical protein
MRTYLKYFIIILTVYGCDVFEIGTKKAPPIEVNQKSAVGVVYLFKAEIDSNNITGAVRIILKNDGKQYLASDKVEMYDDLSRISRIVAKKPITAIHADSLSPTQMKVKMEVDYTKILLFTTSKINDDWFITSLSE